MISQDFQDFVNTHYSVGRNGQLKNSRGVAITPAKMFEEYSYYAFVNKKELDGLTADDIADYLDKRQQEAEDAKKAKKDTPSTDKIIAEFMDCHRQYWNISTTMAMIERKSGDGKPGKPADLGELATAITVWAQNKRGYSVSPQTVRMNLQEYMSELKTKILGDLFQRIGYIPGYEAKCRAALLLIHKMFRIKEDPEIFILAMMHWMWQVKRKLLSLDAVWDLWINFFGGAGIGKSTLLRVFCAVLGEFYDEPGLAVFSDTVRERDKFTNMYVLNFDELTLGEKMNYFGDDSIPSDIVRNMKKMITQKEGSFRTMGGQEQAKRRITFSGISSANQHLYDIIYDDTTMRRYLEFNCMMQADQVGDEYYAAKDQLQANLADIWRGVDESNPKGYLHPGCPVWNKVQEIQASYYPTRTTTSLWVDDQNIVAGGESNTLEIYQEYVDWCKDRGYKSRSQINWIKDIQHIVPGSKTQRRNINISYGDSCE